MDGEAKAYPIRILVRHELVNDAIGDKPILVSYCPLCGSGLVFDRALNGEAVEFGVSGHRLFWFAWYSFHPDTLLRTGD